jgi:hypothetical protein
LTSFGKQTSPLDERYSYNQVDPVRIGPITKPVGMGLSDAAISQVPFSKGEKPNAMRDAPQAGKPMRCGEDSRVRSCPLQTPETRSMRGDG